MSENDIAELFAQVRNWLTDVKSDSEVNDRYVRLYRWLELQKRKDKTT